MTKFNSHTAVSTIPAAPGTRAVVYHPHEEGEERWHVRPVVGWSITPSGTVLPVLWSLSKEATDAAVAGVVFLSGDFQRADPPNDEALAWDGCQLTERLRYLGAHVDTLPYYQ